MSPILSICIPTYNRSQSVKKLVNCILSETGDFEVCVHVDGSTDDTLDILGEIADPRLVVSYSSNAGRASALCSACRKAQGKFIMLFDDDDSFTLGGLQRILKDCELLLPEAVVGHIYHMVDDKGEMIGSRFPNAISNFMSLRADEGVFGDKKEVVLASVLLPVLIDDSRYRRVPTSLFWTRIAQNYDVICHNYTVGRKIYLTGGMTDNIKKLKKSNPVPMLLLYISLFYGFIKKRYKSVMFASKVFVRLQYYAFSSVIYIFNSFFENDAFKLIYLSLILLFMS